MTREKQLKILAGKQMRLMREAENKAERVPDDAVGRVFNGPAPHERDYPAGIRPLLQ